MHNQSAQRGYLVSMLVRLVCISLLLAIYPSSLSVEESQAQSELDIRGSISLRISKGRLVFRIGKIVNLSPSELSSGRIELALWLSQRPYDTTQPLRGAKLAGCSFEGLAGGDVIANASCQAKLKFISRGKYYVVIILSELDPVTNKYLVRDSFTSSKRLKF